MSRNAEELTFPFLKTFGVTLKHDICTIMDEEESRTDNLSYKNSRKSGRNKQKRNAEQHYFLVKYEANLSAHQ